MTNRQSEVRTGGWKAFFGPLGRIVLAAVLVGVAVAAAQVVVKALKGVLSLGGAVLPLYYLVYLIASVLVCYFVYRAYVRLVEKRPVWELGGAGAPGELGVGGLVGCGVGGGGWGRLWVVGEHRGVGETAFRGGLLSTAKERGGGFGL